MPELRLLVHCPQNSGCTLFTLYMCHLLSTACQPDLPACEQPASTARNNYKNYAQEHASTPSALAPFVGPMLGAAGAGSWVMKATIVGRYMDMFSRTKRHFTHRILFFNDPVRQLQSLSAKKWRNVRARLNCMPVSLTTPIRQTHRLTPVS